MINIAICDDDENTLKAIAKITEAAIITMGLDAEVCMATSSQSNIYESVSRHEIDVLFLDIDFNDTGKNGVEFAKELRKTNKDFKLIFITAHFEYAILAYKCKTFDYIMKPADMDKICDILKRLKDDVTSPELGLFKVNKDSILRTKDILYIERNKSKATVHTADSSYETCCSLSSLEHELPNSFIRVHRSYIVNSEQITRIDKDDKSIYFCSNKSCPLGQFNMRL